MNRIIVNCIATLLLVATSLSNGVTLLSPTGGEHFRSGDLGLITWSGSGNYTMRIILWDALRGSFSTVADGIPINAAKFYWVIPATSGDLYRIIIRAKEDTSVVAMGSAFFTISDTEGNDTINAPQTYYKNNHIRIVSNSGGSLRVRFEDSSHSRTLQLFDINGRSMSSHLVSIFAISTNTSEAVIDTSMLTSGIYLLSLTGTDNRASAYFTVVK